MADPYDCRAEAYRGKYAQYKILCIFFGFIICGLYVVYMMQDTAALRAEFSIADVSAGGLHDSIICDIKADRLYCKDSEL